MMDTSLVVDITLFSFRRTEGLRGCSKGVGRGREKKSAMQKEIDDIYLRCSAG